MFGGVGGGGGGGGGDKEQDRLSTIGNNINTLI